MRWNRPRAACAALLAPCLACGCLGLGGGQAPTPFASLTSPSRAAPGAPAPLRGPPPPDPAASPVTHVGAVASEEPASVQAAELSQRLAETRDENKVLAARVLELQGWLDEKVRALDQARSEVRAVTAEVARTRDEIQRWRREADGLRQRALHAEQENQASLRAMAQLVQMMLDQEAAARPGTPP